MIHVHISGLEVQGGICPLLASSPPPPPKFSEFLHIQNIFSIHPPPPPPPQPPFSKCNPAYLMGITNTCEHTLLLHTIHVTYCVCPLSPLLYDLKVFRYFHCLLVCIFGDLNSSGDSVALRTTCDVHCVPKQTIARHSHPHYPSHHLPTVNTYPHLKEGRKYSGVMMM